MRAYKFYSKSWGLEALYRRRLKITTVPELNDPFEFEAVSRRLKADRVALIKLKKKLFSDKGLVSFSMGWTNPVIWSHYAESHKGLALGFDIQDDIALTVNYEEERINISKLRRGGLTKEEKYFSKRIMATKFKHWEYENEVRIFSSLLESQCEKGIYFEPFGDRLTLREVIIGARYETGNNQKLHDDLLGEGINFTTTRLAFKSFAVVLQEKQRMWKSL